ncbi:RNA-binding protein MEX3B [Neocloeon triangulifer]|uniref:RNA-binding protein MEX3B n=1 Tax=Neocloeon triangulifer TaxID=2078957 RepID=UPI00286F04F4|nr:RNA-binding protein MEX3B [Neocloeon triangulifer]
MPASLFPEMDRNAGDNGLEDQRALQLAFELSMLGFSSHSAAEQGDQMNQAYADDSRNKKSQNMTECVPVPSSEHVAEIVGRQGCKIKALRAKTNTYIKTPVRGEEPVFVVTGRKEDVTKAKREILSAAEHFSQIRASRKSSTLANLTATAGGATLAAAPNSMPGHVTIQVRVPYRVVGLVVGPKGATIKRIQHQTHTYIVTPSRDKEPVFEVTGLPESVEAARREIEAHIAMRTGAGGGLLDGSDTSPPSNDDDLFSSFLKNGLNALATRFADAAPAPPPAPTPFFHADTSAAPFSSCSSSSSTSSTSRLAELTGSIWSGSHDEGLGESPSLDSAASIWSDVKLAPLMGGGGPQHVLEHLPARRVSSDPLALSASPTDSMGSLSSGGARRECTVCGDKEIAAALVPCGHNLFCFDCAERVSEQPAQCPACQQPVLQAIRIFS